MPLATTQVMLNQFLLGGVVVACLGVGLFFLRFWRKKRQRLFAIFALAFWLLGANWTALAFARSDEARTALYVIRLAAFLLILLAIVDRNLPRGGSSSPPSTSDEP
jgi:hypothetical protein